MIHGQINKFYVPYIVFNSLFSYLFYLLLLQHFKNKYDGEFEDALKFVVKFLNNPPKYYAKVTNFLAFQVKVDEESIKLQSSFKQYIVI